MSSVKEWDTSLWLQNKLGSSETWSGGTIWNQLNPELLKNLRDTFLDLQKNVKLKFLLAFFHFPKRNVNEWRVELEEIIEVARGDCDQWVAMLAEIMKEFPSTGRLNLEVEEPEENKEVFQDVLEELGRELKEGNGVDFLPLECLYLNRKALISVIGEDAVEKNCTLLQHFTMKGNGKVSKMDRLRAELLQRASEAGMTSAKKVLPAVPVRSRGMPKKMTNMAPPKGIASGSQTATSSMPVPRSFAARTSLGMGKKEGGVKLLDFAELPSVSSLAKRRKKGGQEGSSSSKIAAASAADRGKENEIETPEYAAGLSSASTPLISPLFPPPSPMLFQFSKLPVPTETSAPIPPIPANPAATPSPIPKLQEEEAFQRQTRVSVTNESAKLTKVVLEVQASEDVSKELASLPQEVLDKAQEVFKMANAITLPEKELILRFMAGKRVNPCPEIGSVVSIKLNEREKEIQEENGTAIKRVVEIHFQMDFETGEWKVFEKVPACNSSQ